MQKTNPLTHTLLLNYSHSYKWLLSLSRLGFQQVPVTQFNLSIKLLKIGNRFTKKSGRKKMSFFKNNLKTFSKKCLKLPFIMVQSNFNHWPLYSVLVSYTARNPKGVVADNPRVYFLLKLYAPCGSAPCCTHSGSQGWRNTYLYCFCGGRKRNGRTHWWVLKHLLGIPSLLYTNFTPHFWPKPVANGQGDILWQEKEEIIGNSITCYSPHSCSIFTSLP